MGEAARAKSPSGGADHAPDGGHRQEATLFQHEKRPRGVAGVLYTGDACGICPRPREVVADLPRRATEGFVRRRVNAGKSFTYIQVDWEVSRRVNRVW